MLVAISRKSVINSISTAAFIEIFIFIIDYSVWKKIETKKISLIGAIIIIKEKKHQHYSYIVVASLDRLLLLFINLYLFSSGY